MMAQHVLYADMSVRQLSEKEFQGELGKPVNAEFAKAMREAEGQ